MTRAVVALDTNVLIYVLEANEEFGRAASMALRAAQDNGTVSAMIYLEILSKAGFTDVRRKRLALAFLAEQQLIITPVTQEVLLRAAELRASLAPRLSAGDALHLASAMQTGAETFITNDRHLTRLPISGIEIIGL